MLTINRHRLTGSDIFQVAGLLFMIGFIYRHFGPQAHPPATLAVITIFAMGTLVLTWPRLIKTRV